MNSLIFWIGLTLGALLSFVASVAANLYNEHITEAIQKRKLSFKAKTKGRELERYELVKKLHGGEADKTAFFVTISMQSVRYLILAACSLTLAFVGLGTSKDQVREIADVFRTSGIFDLSFYTSVLVLVAILVFIAAAIFAAKMSFKQRRLVMDVAEKLDNFEEYEVYLQQRWGCFS
jgi:uncharacterized membrane protein